MPKSPHSYDDSKIKTLSSVDHIRLRTGMYIGRLGDGSDYDDGIYVLLKEVIDNAVDEHIMGHGSEIHIDIKDRHVIVRDFGRGIPLGKVSECVSQINTGAKYNDDVFQFSVGLNGVGLKAVNALSSAFRVRSHREGRFAEATFARGRPVRDNRGDCPDEPNGTLIEFEPDPEIFGTGTFRAEHLERRLRFYAYLNIGLKLILNGVAQASRNGLCDLVKADAGDEALYAPLHLRDRDLELSFTHCPRTHEEWYSFVNGQFTSDGGTHLTAFREGLLRAVNEFSKKKFEGDDVREGMVGAVAIRLKNPVFESQTKNRLGNTELRADLTPRIRDGILDLLHRNPADAQTLIDRIDEIQRLRRELLSVRKLARERARAVTLRVPQLKDCRHHLNRRTGAGLDSMIFITEGQSAAGSIIQCRDVNTQAIFALKGKPLNVAELSRDAIYKNDEIYNLMKSLNIEESIEGLRYQKIILATDADVDGLHIRNLLITYFLRFFERLVAQGHLYILETPLFRVRTKARTIYCHAEEERDAALKTLGNRAEITRFKGLGEISPAEFAPFIGPEMRLSPVSSPGPQQVAPILRFYMGRNTPDRRAYIMNHLVVTPEE